MNKQELENEEVRQELLKATRQKKWKEFIEFEKQSDNLLDATLDMDNKKVALSITKVQQDAEKAEYQDFLAKQDNTAVTIGDEVNE